MHEASIAMSVIEIAERHCLEAGYKSISNIALRIGGASGVLPDALVMAFDIVKLDTIAKEAILKIEEIPLGGTCRICGRDFITQDQFIVCCPHCDGRDLELTTGRELDIIDIEVE